MRLIQWLFRRPAKQEVLESAGFWIVRLAHARGFSYEDTV